MIYFFLNTTQIYKINFNSFSKADCPKEYIYKIFFILYVSDANNIRILLILKKNDWL